MFVLCTAILVIVAAAICSIHSGAPVSVHLLSWKFSAPLPIIVFLAFLIGVITTALFGLAARSRRQPWQRSRDDRIGDQNSIVSLPKSWNDYRVWLSVKQ